MTELPPTFQALCEALDDEYKARAAYRAIIAKFGPILPFANIVQSEQRHADALLRLFAMRGWQPPADRWEGQVIAPDTVAEACRMGVDAEIENVALYNRLFAMTDDPEVLSVFSALRWASQERHLPAFQRCLNGEQTDGGCGCSGNSAHRRQGHGGTCCGGGRGRRRAA